MTGALNGTTRAVISGVGIVSAIGHTVPEFAESLRLGRSGIVEMTVGDGHCMPAAEIRGFSFPDALDDLAGIGKTVLEKAWKTARRSHRGAQIAAVAALQAWQDAGLEEAAPAADDVAVILAGHNVNQQQQYERSRTFLNEHEYVPPSYGMEFMDSDVLGMLSGILDTHGEGFTCGAASASGNLGILQGRRLIEMGGASACLVVGPVMALSPVELRGLYDLGALGGRKFSNDPAKACRPFDREHEGFIYGQACACVVLESRSAAQRRGRTSWGEIAGASVVLDGNRGPNPSHDGEVRAMRRALAEAGVEPGEVDYLNAHGTSAPLGDSTEVAAIKTVFAGVLDRLQVNSTKGLTGHCLCSAGVVELIATVIQMKQGFIHPNMNLITPIDEAIRFAPARSEPASIDISISNGFGFGGFNTSIVVRRDR